MRLLVSVLLAFAVTGAGPIPRQEAADTASSSKIWVGRHAEFEGFLEDALIVRLVDLSEGVTRPRRAFFDAGGPAASAIIKTIRPVREGGVLDSYKSEIAAYELDKLLGLDMVPPTVERRVDWELVSAQLWVERCSKLKDKAGQTSPDIAQWNRQIYRQRVFDNLIANTDRNAKNVLIDPCWNLILIDHSRTFDARSGRQPNVLTRIDRELLARLRALDRRALVQRVRPWLEFDVDFILERRDRIVGEFERLIREKGERAVLID